jgi:hypothetical protein
MKMERAECFETLAYKIQKPGNYPEESTKHSEQGERLKSTILALYNSQKIGSPAYWSCLLFLYFEDFFKYYLGCRSLVFIYISSNEFATLNKEVDKV